MTPHDRDPFAELADDARAEGEVEVRSVRRWLGRQAAETATLAGLLVDLAERTEAVALRTRSGRVHRGRIDAVGADFAAVGGGYVRLAAIVTVQVEPSTRPSVATGDRTPVRATRLADALADLAGERPDVVVVTEAGDRVTGALLAVGVDILTVATTTDRRLLVHVALDSVSEVLVAG